MAISRIKYGGVRGKALNYSEFLCDGIEDLENLPTNTKKTDDFPATCAIGSRAFIGDDTYMLFPSEGWKPSKLVVCDCGCIHGTGSESEEGAGTDEPTTEDTTAEDLDKALSTIAAIIDGSITKIEDTKVTGIRDGAFAFCTNLTHVSLPNATSIGDSAFYECTAMTDISLPNVASIKQHTFECCTSLKSIDLPNANIIDTYAFGDCTSLTHVSLPNATSIGDNAFSGCTNLTTIKLPSATTIGVDAFKACTALTDLYLPGAEASYTNAPFGLGTETYTIHYEYDFTQDEGEANTETPTD